MVTSVALCAGTAPDMQRLKPHWRSCLLAASACLLVALGACDPLAPDSAPIVVVITQTPTRSPVASPLPASTATPIVTEVAVIPTTSISTGTGAIATLTATATSCSEPKGQVL